jgi:hypothetical protein
MRFFPATFGRDARGKRAAHIGGKVFVAIVLVVQRYLLFDVIGEEICTQTRK